MAGKFQDELDALIARLQTEKTIVLVGTKDDFRQVAECVNEGGCSTTAMTYVIVSDGSLGEQRKVISIVDL